MTKQTNQQILAQFAQVVGKDIKDLHTLVQGKISQAEVINLIQTAVTTLRSELYGGEVDAALDTLRELGERLISLEQDDSIKAAILTKFNELRQDISTLQQKVEAQTLPNDLIQTYTTAKGV